jgi:hypothetical protein
MNSVTLWITRIIRPSEAQAVAQDSVAEMTLEQFQNLSSEQRQAMPSKESINFYAQLALMNLNHNAMAQEPLPQAQVPLIRSAPQGAGGQSKTSCPEPTQNQRLLGASIALIMFVGVLIATLLALEATAADDRTIHFVSQAFTYSGLGAAMVGWKWPQAVFAPFKRLLALLIKVRGNSAGTLHVDASISQSGIRKILSTPLQRGLFAVACFGLGPWFFMRFIRELWRSAGFSDYLESVFVAPVSPWFESGWWWYTQLEWHDWPVLPSLIGLGLALTWPHTGGRLVGWVRGSK